MDGLEFIIFFVLVMLGFTLSGIIGFGANVLTLPILSLFFNVSDLVIVFAVISFINATYRVVENRKGIIWKDFFKIMAVTVPGTILGLWVLKNFSEVWLKLILGIFVVGVAAYNLTEKKKEKPVLQKNNVELKIKSLFYNLILFFGGMMQGAFVCGGPLYLIYCSHYYQKNRLQFRGMQFAVILMNSSIIFFSYLWRGVYRGYLITQSLIGLSALLAAIIISNICLKYITDNKLYRLVQIVLLISGITLIVQNSLGLL